MFRIEDFKRFVEVATYAFDKHRIMICVAESVCIQFEESCSVAEGSLKLAVFIQDDGVAKAIT